MEYFHFYGIFIVLLPSLALWYTFFRNESGLPTNWPIVGMLPALLVNVHRVHHFVIDLMQKSNLTFKFKGPWFSNMHFITTVDPSNVQHVFSKKFENYNKGPKFNEVLEFFGTGIFNSDSSLWHYHRKLSQSFFGHRNFHSFTINKILEEIETRLMPMLDHFAMHGIEFDLQEVFKRFAYDNICTILIDYDPKFLSLDLPPIRLSEAVTIIEEVLFTRNVLPTFVWKSLRWLGVGEKGYKEACETLDSFIYKRIAEKREQKTMNNTQKIKDVEVSNKIDDFLTVYLDDEEKRTNTIIRRNCNNDVFLRDAFINYFIAGGDTTSVSLSWLFYVLVRYASVTAKVRDELKDVMTRSNVALDGLLSNFSEYKDKLVYLHAVICETLRLYPPTPYNPKASIKPDILPSGHRVGKNMQILFDTYAMGRMKLIWGDDCDEFKPERWITEQGKIKFESSYKLNAFGAGPRICLGKDMSYTQMKLAVAAIIPKYEIEMVEGHQVIPDVSVVLQMKHGLKVKINKIYP